MGINIEDSAIQGTTRTLKDAGLFAGTISFIRNKLRSEGLDIFINIRCDTFILNVDKPLEETIRRLKIYDSMGADGIFLPCISAEDDISAVMRNTQFPLNVMAIPGLPGFETLNRLGVKRVSMGSFLFNKVYDNINDLVREITVSKMNLPKRAEDAHAALAAAFNTGDPATVMSMYDSTGNIAVGSCFWSRDQ